MFHQIFSLSTKQPATDDDSKEDTLDGECNESGVGHVVINASQAHVFVASGFKGKSNDEFFFFFPIDCDWAGFRN